MIQISPQPGPQTEFLRNPADIIFYGGSAGGGKSFALLLDALRHVHRPHFGAVIFRRTTPEIKNEGGLWDESQKLYPYANGLGSRHALRWNFPSGASVSFSHMEHEDDRFSWQGSQIGMIGFDELTHFTERQFFYMLSRNRSTAIKPVIRATTNPDADSWVANFISWWIDQETGYAIQERSGVVRWFTRDGDDIVWGDSREEIIEQFGPESEPKSFTFIRAKLEDNQILMRKDPSYLASLNALSRVDRERLKNGNWKIRPSAGLFYRKEWFEVVDAAPADFSLRARYWDRAATKVKPGKKKEPDRSASVLLSKDKQGIYYIEHAGAMMESPHVVERAMVNMAKQDGRRTMVGYMQDPGSAGVNEAQATARALEGYQVHFAPATGDKQTRAKPCSSQAEAGNIKIVRAPWNEPFLNELENFPDSNRDDQVDALSGAFELITQARIILIA
jgi:predicted phage terminase large subunit-like protein